MSTTSATYLIIFLPLISSLLCQLFSKRESSFLISCGCFLAVLILLFKLFPNLISGHELISDFELLPLSLALEFKISLASLLFLWAIILLKLIILIYYQSDIKIFLDEKNSRIFYSVYLLNLFTIIGIFTTNNLLNLFLFLEIYAGSFFAIFSISKDSQISKLSFRYFCFNAVASLAILFCFLIIYLIYGSLNLDVIRQNLESAQNWKFIAIISVFIAGGFIIKFFPFWLYFENLKNSNLFANFFAVDSLFIKANIGIFLAFKFSYLFFINEISALLLILGAMTLICYSLLQIYRTKHFKLIAIYSCLNSFAFLLICLSLHNQLALQAAFFYWLNFNLIGFFLFIFATFLKRKFNTSSIDKIFLIAPKSSTYLLLPLKLSLIFIAAFPFTFLFYGNWQLLLVSLKLESKLMMFLVFAIIIISNFTSYIFGFKLAKTLFNQAPSAVAPVEIEATNYWFYLISFWSIMILIYVLTFAGGFLNKISLQFGIL